MYSSGGREWGMVLTFAGVVDAVLARARLGCVVGVGRLEREYAAKREQQSP